MSLAYAIAFLAAAAFFAVSTWTGCRLIGLWRRTRRTPELLMGLGLLAIGTFGFGLGMAAEMVGDGHAGLASALRLGGTAMISMGSMAFAGFIWIVFHPGARWAAALNAVAGLAYVGLLAVSVRHVWLVGPDRYDPAMVPRAYAMSLVWAWMGIECVRYWSKTRRRQALGLADPMVVNRFALWAFVSIASLVNNSISTTISARAGGNAMNQELAVLVTGMLGLAGAVGIFLAFLPPVAYERWVRGESGAPASAPSAPSPSASASE